MIRTSLQRITQRVSGRQLARLGARLEAAAVVQLESNTVVLLNIQQRHNEAQLFHIHPQSLGLRQISSDGPSSQENSEDASETGATSEDTQSSSRMNGEATSSAEEGTQAAAGSESASEGTGEDARAPPRNVYRPPEDVPVPDASEARRIIEQFIDDDLGSSFKINHAGEHNIGWQLYDVDEENTIVWWLLDLTGGRVPDNEKNAQLSDHVKHFMYRLNKEGRWSVPQIAELFRVRQQRVMAIVALKEMEVAARERGEELQEDLHEDMERVFECHELRGKFERHVRLLPTKPAFEVVGTAGAGRKKGKGNGQGGPGRVYESHEDPGWESEVRTREAEVAAYEERIMVKEFRERLAFNIGKVGQSISNQSRARNAPKRPEGGWSIVVRPAGRGVEYEPFVARPDGSRRPLTPDESLYIDRMKPRRRRRIL